MKLSIYFSFICFVVTGCFTISKKSTQLVVGVPAEWGELVPSLQHTAYADAILSNQFESLVRVGSGGVVEPLAAKSWTINNDFTVFTFKIDRYKKFSNGKVLSSKDFKDSWEHALALAPKSANSSLQDVLYKVVGFDKFPSTKTLSGLETPDDETLVIHFTKPFRTALVYLSGSRMAAAITTGNSYLGTGAYSLVSQSNGTAEFIKNPHSDLSGNFDKVIYTVVPTGEAVDALINNKIQLYTFAEKTQIDDCSKEDAIIACFLGSASRHFTVILNGKNAKIFANKNNRKAFQSLVIGALLKTTLPAHLQQTLVIDPQLFLPLQKGQIDPAEAQKIVDEGKPFVSDLVKATRKKPLLVKTSHTENWLVDFIKGLGVSVSEESGVVDTKSIVDTYYKKHDVDVLAMGIGVVSGDPDGIYHALGKDGSISSPMSYRKPVADALELGRTILDEKNIATHYQAVTKVALEEVPFIHLGFLKTKMAYRSDLVKVKSNFKQREDDRLIIFSPN